MVPFLRPRPPSLAEMTDRLLILERSGTYTNNGPNVRSFEARMTAEMFGGVGDCVTVCNATLGLMLAIRALLDRSSVEAVPNGGRRYALMPSFTFAATAQAAIWNGLTPLFCDIDPESWIPDPGSEEALLRRFGEEIAVVVPYATFGADIDLRRYEALSERFGVPVVVDAAASLGSRGADGSQFGAGSTLPVVFSMHATKPFATGEAGLVYSADPALTTAIRGMANFGIDRNRSATMSGLNAKLSEVGGLLALGKLDEFEGIADRLGRLMASYRALLPENLLQQPTGMRQVGQFMPVLLPSGMAGRRQEILEDFAARGIGTGKYFSPHLAEQPYFRALAPATELPNTEDVAARMLSLPLWDGMTADMVEGICGVFSELCPPARSGVPARPAPVEPRSSMVRDSRGLTGPGNAVGLVVIGAGPAGMAPLLAASRNGLLPELLSQGVILVERDPVIGAGRLAQYAISSDSAAVTFLSCVEDHPVPELAALAQHPMARAIAAYGKDAVPLAMVGMFMALVAREIAALVEASPRGRVLCGQEAMQIRRVPGGAWCVRLRCGRTGEEREILTRQVLVATGGHQSHADLRTAQIGGVALLPAARGRLLRSDELLRSGGAERVARHLAGVRDPRIVVLGGSTSAVSSVRVLLDAFGDGLSEGGVTLAHRSELKLFFTSADEARSNGYHAFDGNDICPLSGFVYRFGGLRYVSRDTVAGALGVRDRNPDPRLRLHRVAVDDPGGDVARLLDRADLVVAALGYRPRGLLVLDEAGDRVPLLHERGGGPMVGADCAVLDAAGVAIPNLFGIGLAAGYRPGEAMGGEASFTGQVNGLWLWQNDVGLALTRRLLAPGQPSPEATRRIA